jgi:hypothetical protein
LGFWALCKAGRKVKSFLDFLAATQIERGIALMALGLAFLPAPSQAQLQGPVQDIGVRPSLLKEV